MEHVQLLGSVRPPLGTFACLPLDVALGPVSFSLELGDSLRNVTVDAKQEDGMIEAVPASVDTAELESVHTGIVCNFSPVEAGIDGTFLPGHAAPSEFAVRILPHHEEVVATNVPPMRLEPPVISVAVSGNENGRPREHADVPKGVPTLPVAKGAQDPSIDTAAYQTVPLAGIKKEKVESSKSAGTRTQERAVVQLRRPEAPASTVHVGMGPRVLPHEFPSAPPLESHRELPDGPKTKSAVPTYFRAPPFIHGDSFVQTLSQGKMINAAPQSTAIEDVAGATPKDIPPPGLRTPSDLSGESETLLADGPRRIAAAMMGENADTRKNLAHNRSGEPSVRTEWSTASLVDQGSKDATTPEAPNKRMDGYGSDYAVRPDLAGSTSDIRLAEVPPQGAADMDLKKPLAPGLLSDPEAWVLPQTQGHLSRAAGSEAVSISPARLDQYVVQQVVEAAASNGDGQVDIHLEPRELGKVKLSLVSNDGGMTVVISTERPETSDLLRRNIEMLAQHLRDIGYRDLQFDFSQNSQRSPPSMPDVTEVLEPETDPTESPQLTEQSNFPACARVDGLDLRL